MSFKHRLHHRWEYTRFFDQSEVFRLSNCVIFRVPNTCGHFRLGITLKARGSSVERNRVKRTIRECVRHLGPLLGSFDYNVVIPASKKMAFPYHLKLRKTLEYDFKRELMHAGNRC